MLCLPFYLNADRLDELVICCSQHRCERVLRKGQTMKLVDGELEGQLAMVQQKIITEKLMVEYLWVKPRAHLARVVGYYGGMTRTSRS